MDGAKKRSRGSRLHIVAAAAVVLFAVMLTSCEPVLSVHRLYTDADLVFDPSLVGTWIVPNPSDHSDFGELTFAAGTLNEYLVTMTFKDGEQTAKGYFRAHLVRLRGREFLDVVQSGAEIDGKSVDGSMAIPGHMFARIAVNGDALAMTFLDDSWMTRQIEASNISIEVEKEGHDPDVLTAPTADLQKLVVDHADDDEAFSVTLDGMTRKKSNAP